MEKQSGFLLINKPVGPTSHDIVDKLRKITGIRKIGHAGTLDPFASGLLIMAIGRKATMEIQYFVGLPKIYEAVFVLGAISNTDDATGEITVGDVKTAESLDKKVVEAAIQNFIGEIEQIPPMFSAIKIKGKKLYEHARKGEVIKRAPRNVKILEYKLLEKTGNKLHVRIHCSSGTYIRALARDLGEILKVGGYVESLIRTSIDSFLLADSSELKDITEQNWEERLLKFNPLPIPSISDNMRS